MLKRWQLSLMMSVVASVGCGGSKTQTGGAPADMAGMVGTGIKGEHGTLIDYFTSAPLVGFTITDGQATTTSDAQGSWVLPVTMGVPLAPVVTGPDYSTIFLGQAMPASDEIELGPIPMPSAMSFALENQILAADTTQAVVQITIVKQGACTSIAGGTLNVKSPAGASVAYFSAQGLPTGPSFVDRDSNRPVAAVYNVTPGQQIELEIVHPTCKLVAAGTSNAGAVFTGKVTTMASQPGDNNSSLVYLVE